MSGYLEGQYPAEGFELISGGSSDRPDVDFAMNCNGFFQEGYTWKLRPNSVQQLVNEFSGTRISFFGPGPQDHFFELRRNLVSSEMEIAFARISHSHPKGGLDRHLGLIAAHIYH